MPKTKLMKRKKSRMHKKVFHNFLPFLVERLTPLLVQSLILGFTFSFYLFFSYSLAPPSRADHIVAYVPGRQVAFVHFLTNFGGLFVHWACHVLLKPATGL